MEKGWISIHRSLLNHWVWKKSRKPRSEVEAWIFMLIRANHSPGKIVSGSHITEIPRGSFVTSYRDLIEEFGWSQGRLKNFLEILKKDLMIDLKTDTRGTMISITNYNSYQNTDTPTDTGPIHQQIQHGYRTDTASIRNNKNNNKNKKNNVNNEGEETTSKIEFAPFVFLSQSEYDKLLNDFGEEFTKRCCEKLSAWIEQDPTPKRKRNGQNGSATFRAWVLNAVSDEQTRAARQTVIKFQGSKSRSSINTESTVDVVKSFLQQGDI